MALAAREPCKKRDGAMSKPFDPNSGLDQADIDDPEALSLSEARAQAIVEAAIRRYAADRRAMAPAFIDKWYGLFGALRLHRKALGWDLLRAPANLLLAAPQLALQLGGATARRMGAKRAGDWMRARRLILHTDVAREVEWAVYTELLELPFEQNGRRSDRDALAETIMRDPAVAEALAEIRREISARGSDPDLKTQIADSVAVYTGSRAAAAEIATAMTGVGVGAAAFHQFTPSMLSLGPTLAAVMAHQTAVASFPLGSGLGSIWYGFFPASPSGLLVAGVTGGLMVGAAVLAAFAGIFADPVQRRLGLHQRRLAKLIDTLEEQMIASNASGFQVRDHYVARLVDMFDVLRAIWRATHGH